MDLNHVKYKTYWNRTRKLLSPDSLIEKGDLKMKINIILKL